MYARMMLILRNNDYDKKFACVVNGIEKGFWIRDY